MTRWFLLLVVLAGDIVLANVVENLLSRPSATGRIVGGGEVEISQYSYQLSVQNDGYHFCGGSAVGAKWALTAGHCCDGNVVSQMSIRGGSSTQNDGGIIFTVRKMVLHPSYNPDNLDFDVCMIKINGSFLQHANISILALSNSGSIPSNEIGTVSGWGATVTDGDSVDRLRATKVKILSERSCTSQTRKYVATTQSMFCAGNVGSSICVGDSGGPLVLNQQQVGIVSFIILECGGVAPAVYTRISNKSVRDFITQQLNSP